MYHIKIHCFEGVYLIQLFQGALSCCLIWTLDSNESSVLHLSNTFPDASCAMTVLISVLMGDEVISQQLWKC